MDIYCRCQLESELHKLSEERVLLKGDNTSPKLGEFIEALSFVRDTLQGFKDEKDVLDTLRYVRDDIKGPLGDKVYELWKNSCIRNRHLVEAFFKDIFAKILIEKNNVVDSIVSVFCDLVVVNIEDIHEYVQKTSHAVLSSLSDSEYALKLYKLVDEAIGKEYSYFLLGFTESIHNEVESALESLKSTGNFSFMFKLFGENYVIVVPFNRIDTDKIL